MGCCQHAVKLIRSMHEFMCDFQLYRVMISTYEDDTEEGDDISKGKVEI